MTQKEIQRRAVFTRKTKLSVLCTMIHCSCLQLFAPWSDSELGKYSWQMRSNYMNEDFLAEAEYNILMDETHCQLADIFRSFDIRSALKTHTVPVRTVWAINCITRGSLNIWSLRRTKKEILFEKVSFVQRNLVLWNEIKISKSTSYDWKQHISRSLKSHRRTIIRKFCSRI